MIVDYLSFTFKAEMLYSGYLDCQPVAYQSASINMNTPHLSYTEYCISLVNTFLLTVNPSGDQSGISARVSSKGTFGYQSSMVIITNDQQQIGIVGYEGNNGTLLVSITGKGCRYFDMDQVEFYLKLVSAKITRIDIAKDFFEGEYDLEYAKECYSNGLFQIESHTAAPSARLIDDLGSGSGCTLYVGKVKNGKSCRIYEKAKQLGDKEGLWVRWELQLGSRDRTIPLDIFSHLAEYFCASYPAFDSVINHNDIDPEMDARIKIDKKTVEISYSSLLHYGRLGYGRLLGFMKNELCMTNDKIVDSLIRAGSPSRLSGFLGVSFKNEIGGMYHA